jgi:hypothetical protein
MDFSNGDLSEYKEDHVEVRAALFRCRRRLEKRWW